MDNLDLAKVAVTAFVSATGAVVVWSWKLSALLARHEQKIEDNTERAKKAEEDCEQHFAKVELEQQQQSKEQANRWSEINRTLGTIQGELSATRHR